MEWSNGRKHGGLTVRYEVGIPAVSVVLSPGESNKKQRKMKKHFICFICLVMLPFTAIASGPVTLDLSAIVDTYTQTPDGYWDSTYTQGVIEEGLFRFSHTGSMDGGGGMAYWEGFTLCTSGDTTNYGAEGSSDGWIAHQWGCMAGGGVDSLGHAVQGSPYLVAYWGFFLEQSNPDYHSLRIDFTDGQTHGPVGVWICNHPWPYYGNLGGDGFASAFSQEGDYFALVAHGLNAQGEPTGSSTRLMLATYSCGALHQSPAWLYMDLSPLGAVSGLFFTMETSDVNALYGANTAVYFCLDRLTVTDTDTTLIRPAGLSVTAAGEDSLTLCWSPVGNATGYALWLNGQSAGSTTDTMFTFLNLQPYTSYQLGVAAVHATDTSNVASVTAMTTDETAPAMPSGLQAESGLYNLSLMGQPAEDNVGIRRYTVFVDGQAYRRTTTCTCDVVGLEPHTEYLLEVEAEDQAGNKSAKASLRATTGPNALDTVPADDETQGYYSPDGRYLGSEKPRQSGVYIRRSKQKTNILLIK